MPWLLVANPSTLMASLSTGTAFYYSLHAAAKKKSRCATNEVKREERNLQVLLASKLTVPGESSNDTALVCVASCCCVCSIALQIFLAVFGLASRQCCLSPDLRAFSRPRLREPVVEDSMSKKACRARDATSSFFCQSRHREAKACLHVE